MSYLVLARKWRSNTFDEVVGQGHVTRTLKNAIELDRVAHALLFTGSRGVGKTSCARILAKALNCENGPTVTPCGVCPACVEITGGTSVDVFEIDGASNNSVEQIREIRESVKFLPTRGKRKVYIIDEVHMLSTSAFNALLKTLEEPPAHVLFVFATTEPHKIPDTIISRCQRYDFKRIPERDIVEHLGRIAGAEGITVEPAALHHIAREARGGMRDSLSLLDQVIAFCGTTISEAHTREVLGIADRQVLHQLTAAVFAGDGQAALEIVDQLFRFGLDLQKFAAEFVQHLRDLMVVKVCAEPGRLVDVADEEVAAMVDLVSRVEPARIHRVFNALLQGADEVARSPFPKLVLEMTLLRLCHQGATLPLSQVLDGLARLESRLGGPASGQTPPAAPPMGSAPSGGSMAGGPGGSMSGGPGGSMSGGPGGGMRARPAPTGGMMSSGPRPGGGAHRGPAPAADRRPPMPTQPPARPAMTAAPTPPTPRPAPSPPTPPPAAAKPKPPPPKPKPAPPKPAGRNDGNDGRRTFKRRSDDAPGTVDDFSGPPPTPKPPAQLPRLAVKPRQPGVRPPPFVEDEPAGEPGVPPGNPAGPPAGRPGPGPSGVSAAPPVDADAVDEQDDMPARPVDFDDGAFSAYVGLVEQLKAINGLTGGRIEHETFLIGFTHDALELAVPRGEFDALQPDLDRLRRLARKAVAPDLRVDIHPCARGDARLDPTLNPYRHRHALEEAEREARVAAARRDPNIMWLVENLSADVVDVHPN